MPPTTRSGASMTPTQDPLKKGFFTKGQWYCNCQPRLPAVQFQVRRESKNKGRWFYTCQKDRTKGAPGEPENCDFFLWAEDARLREEGALLGRPGAAPTPTQRRLRQTTLAASVMPRAAAERRNGPTPVLPLVELEREVDGRVACSPTFSNATLRASGSSRSPSAPPAVGEVETDSDFSSDDTSDDERAPGPCRAGDKHKRAEEEKEEDYSDWSSDGERQLAAVTDSASVGPGAQGRKRDAFVTPAAARTHDATAAGLPTPALTDRPLRRVLFAAVEAPTPAKRPRTTGPVEAEAGPVSASADPPAADATISEPPTPARPGLAAVVMGLLGGQKLDSEVRARVREELERAEARARGLERGRDAARQAARRLEDRAAELQQRVVTLENERHLQAEARANLRAQLMNLASED